MSIAQYIETEFRRYFPDAHVVCVTVLDEHISVVAGENTYEFDCGSDDDFYRFRKTNTLSICDYITIPLMPE